MTRTKGDGAHEEEMGRCLSSARRYYAACRSVYQYNLGRVDDENPGTMYFRTTDELDISRNGIKCRNIRDFLLDGEWN